MSIKLKLILAMLASLLAVAAATAHLVGEAGDRNVRIAAEQAIAGAAQALASMERADVDKLDTTLHALTANPELQAAFAARDRQRLLAIAAPIFAGLKEKHDITHWYFHEPEPARTTFLRVHKPAQFGDVIPRVTLSKAIETKAIGAGKELGPTAFALRVVEPLRAADGTLLGYVELGEEIDHFLGRMKTQTGDDYGLLIEKRFLDEAAWSKARQGKVNDWNARPSVVVVNTTTGDEKIIDFSSDLASVPAAGRLLDEVEKDGKTFVRGIVPVSDASGRQVGGVFVLHDITALHASMQAARTSILWLLAGVAVILAAFLFVLVQRLVFARLDGMISAMEDLSIRLAGGDYDVRAAPPASDDELGKFEDFFGRFLAVVAGLLRELTTRAKTG